MRSLPFLDWRLQARSRRSSSRGAVLRDYVRSYTAAAGSHLLRLHFCNYSQTFQAPVLFPLQTLGLKGASHARNVLPRICFQCACSQYAVHLTSPLSRYAVHWDMTLVSKAFNITTTTTTILLLLIAFIGANRFFFLQSSHCAANRLQHVCSSGPGAIVCKSRATHRALITCNMSCYSIGIVMIIITIMLYVGWYSIP